ncbi:MFS transporter [Aldersonia sp. NBC_00410]|uniref:MFS transporter n=1 Tax=Aldersonia sp. NBC_00410 TaxID=2975954 RepID=UPI0022547533|nr:MFS transporter [Aldersonia sp. NBC_00410]MCX5043831.1 MFS transporter [Aldersonia sp. NBC_00410]
MAPQRLRTPYWVTFIVLAVATASFALMQSMTVPVIPSIEAQMHTDQTTVTWVLTAYLLSASVFTPIIGRIGDAVGKERMLVFSLAMLCAGSVFAALSTSIGLLIAARVVQGVGGGVMPLSFGIIRDEFPHHKVAGAVSVVSSLTAVGFGAGIVAGGPIVHGLGYAWLFWLPAIVTALAGLAALVFVPESPVRTPGRIPVLPALLLSGWLICLLLALSRAPHWGWSSPKVIALVALAVVIAIAWVLVETHAKVPLVDMRMMRLRGVWTTNLVALLVGVGMYAAFGFLPQFIQTPTHAGYGFGASVTESGLVMLPMAIASFITGLIAAPLAVRIGPKVVVVLGCSLGSVAMFSMAFFHDEVWQVAAVSGLAGFGVGLTFACLAGLIIASVPPEQTGVASGMNANIRTIGGSIGSAVMSSIVAAKLLPDGLPAESGYTAGFVFLGAVFVVAAFAGLTIPALSEQEVEDRLEAEPTSVVGAGATRFSR